MPRLGGEVGFIATMEANLPLECPVLLELGLSVTGSFFHFVIAGPGELDRLAFGGPMDGARDASERELAARFAEQDVGWSHHVGEVGLIIGHLDDTPLALDAHGGTSRSFGKRIRS